MAAQPHRQLTRPAAHAAAPRGAPPLARVRALLAQVPRAAWICALVAVLNATAWGILVPAFQVPDEQSHYAYVEYLVQHGRPPVATQARDTHSTSEDAALAGLKFRELQFAPENGAVWSAAEQARMQALLQRDADRSDGNGHAREVGAEPPLFYALQAVPYALASGGTVLARLQLMRLLSALLAGVTVLFVYLFVREALPAVPEACAVGALGVAFAPMFAFVSGGVNSDALLFAASAALFYLLARGFRRGLDGRLAVAVGAALGIGLMTKFNAWGLLPGTAVALLAMSVRRERALRLRTLRLPALALGVAVSPVLLEAALNATAWDRPAFGASASNYRVSALQPTLGSALSYAWQFYLAPLPGMTHRLTALPLRDLWIKGFVGWFGWLDTTFRPLVYDVALVPLAAIALLGARTFVAQRRRVRARLGELLSYAALALVFMGFVAAASYISYLRYSASVTQIRYLFPLLPLYAALLALAARGAGRRWTPVLGTAFVVLAIAHDVFSQLLVLARYYA
jgi:4-amino-4-deoxy-L-arabinose transferase-like glycosyltransferase